MAEAELVFDGWGLGALAGARRSNHDHVHPGFFQADKSAGHLGLKVFVGEVSEGNVHFCRSFNYQF